MDDKLSPTSRAVLDAFLDTEVDAGNYYATRSRQIAAALRALAERIPIRESTAESHDLFEYGVSRGQELSSMELFAVADELDGYWYG